jgi:hypothetical protein
MKRLSLALIGIIGALFLVLLFGESVPPDALTEGRMHVLEKRIREYFRREGKLPDSLTVLPEVENRDNSIVDGWGRRIEYRIGPENSVVLSGTGRGGRADRNII